MQNIRGIDPLEIEQSYRTSPYCLMLEVVPIKRGGGGGVVGEFSWRFVVMFIGIRVLCVTMTYMINQILKKSSLSK